MARTTGPLMSLEASGKFGGAIVFSSWKGRSYARELVKPSNPKTAKQLGVRAMMAFLAKGWTYLTAPNKATWTTLADSKAISPFDAYIGENLMRWQDYLGPSKENPAAQSANAITTTQVLAGGQGYASVQNTPSGAGTNWGIAIFRSQTAITSPNWNNCVHIAAANGANAITWTDSGVTAGTYHYRSAIINSDGTIGTACADATATVT